jgi:hypothetical protein
MSLFKMFVGSAAPASKTVEDVLSALPPIALDGSTIHVPSETAAGAPDAGAADEIVHLLAVTQGGRGRAPHRGG